MFSLLASQLTAYSFLNAESAWESADAFPQRSTIVNGLSRSQWLSRMGAITATTAKNASSLQTTLIHFYGGGVYKFSTIESLQFLSVYSTIPTFSLETVLRMRQCTDERNAPSFSESDVGCPIRYGGPRRCQARLFRRHYGPSLRLGQQWRCEEAVGVERLDSQSVVHDVGSRGDMPIVLATRYPNPRGSEVFFFLRWQKRA